MSLVFLASPAFSQHTATEEAAAPQTVNGENGQLEIVEDERAVLNTVQVFARKRAESAQEIPVVVTAFDAGALERNAVSGIEDISSLTPGLSVQISGNPVQNVLNLRGIESGNIGVGFDQAVSINIDGVQFSNSEFLRVGQFDLERAEILKGPQALYFGKNSPGGIIALRTADPTNELYTEVQAGYETSIEKWFLKSVASGPISDTVSGRFAVSYSDAQGWWENLHPSAANKNAPNFNELMARGTLRFEPSDAFDATAKFTYHRYRGDDFTYRELVGCSADIAVYAPFDDCKLNGTGESADPSAWAGFDPSLSSLWRDDPYSEYNTYIASLEANYEITGALTLTSVTGYSKLDNQRLDNLITGGLPQFLIDGEHQDQDTFSQEIRLVGDYDRFRFMAGAFLDDRTVTQESAVVLIGNVLPFNLQEITADSWSIFAQAEFDITDQLQVSVGGRYTEETKKYSGKATQANGFVVDGVQIEDGDTFLVFNPELSEDNFSPELTLSYKPASDVNFYVAYKEAFKSGGYSTSQTASRFLPVRRTENDFNAETVDGYEIGAKTQWLDDTLRLNLIWFDYSYQNLQLSAFDPNVLAARVFNAGAAKTKGIEFESMYVPPRLSNLTLTGNVAYLDAYYQEWNSNCNRYQIDVTGAAGGCDVDVDNNPNTDAGGMLAGTGFEAQDRSGDSLRNAPEWVVQLGMNYDDQMTDTLYLRLHGNATWTSEYNPDPIGDPRIQNDAYWMINAGIGIYEENDKWALDLIGRNLTDEMAVNFAEISAFSGGRSFSVTTNPPRSFMLRLTIRPSEWMKD